MAEYVDSTGETRDKATGRNVNPPADTPEQAKADPSSQGAASLRPQSALAQPDQSDIGQMEAGMARARQPYLNDLHKLLNSPQAAHAQLEKVKKEPNPEDYHKYSMEFAAAAAVLGAVAGRWTRAGGTASLNAFSGALKGWQAGNLQAYEEASHQWEQSTKKTLENNKVELERYHEILADKQANIDQKMAAMTLAAGPEFQNSVIYGMAKDGNFNGVAQAVDKMGQAHQRMEGAFGTLTGLRKDQSQEQAAQIDSLNSNPELAQRIMQDKPLEFAKLQAAGEVMGHPLNVPAQGTVPLAKVSATPRSMPAMYMQKFQQEHPHASSDQTRDAAALYTSTQRRASTLAVRSANVDVAVGEAEKAADQALQASAAIPRGNFVPVNQLQQAIRQKTSSPEQRRFDTANAALITAYSQTMSRTGVNTVQAQNRAASVLNTTDSHEAYAAGVDQLKTEMSIVRDAIRDQEGSGQGTVGAPSAGGNDGWGEVKVH